MTRRFVVIILAAMVFAVSSVISPAAQKRERSTTASRKTHAPALGSVEQFKEAFQNDAGKIRFVTLLSPT